ncbi:MAG: hypothetical protein E6Q83_03360 [Thiothrix sp.]|nr:MAG: hypothetical protein E6Q83_03360 [Thiothrix sp.]
MTNTTNTCGQTVKTKSSACILPIKPFTIGEALESGQWRCHNGGMYVVCKDFDGKLPYPDSKYFKGPFGLEDVLNGAIQPCAGDVLCLCPPIWGACNTDGSRCVPAYGLRQCAWDVDPATGEYRLYTSLKEDNHTRPIDGVKTTPKTWDGGYDACGYLNRPVAKDLEGNIYYPGGKDTIFCGVSCAEVNNPDFRIEGGKLRVNFPEIEVTDTRSIPSGSPVKSSKFVTDHGLKFVIDYDASITPSTATAPSGPYRQVVEASNGKEYLLRSGVGYREHHDGKVEMWGRTIVGVGSEDRAVAAVLPVKLDGPITYGNSHISLTDVGWAAAPGQHLDDLPGDYPNDPSTDKLDQTDMGWGPSTSNPTGEFVIWAYQHEQSGSAAIELVSWHLITERGLA